MLMQENILQYIWQFQYFNATELLTTDKEKLQIIHPGNLNNNQGPDFSSAKIKIGQTTWVGNVEVHINSSGWALHNHSSDRNFNNVILHVVWNHDTEVKDGNGNNLPTLELKNRVPKVLLEKYNLLMGASLFIPCEKQIFPVKELTLIHWKQRLVAERLMEKSGKIFSILRETNYHWEETFWRLIASNFGLTVNSNFFMQIAKELPINLLAKHKNQIQQVEAFLFGVSGLLENEFTEKYPILLQKEYSFYKKKYAFKKVEGKLSFLRMRPANFPTIRLAQLAMLIHQSEHMFSKIRNTISVKEVKKMLLVSANDYWNYHYVFDEETAYKEKKMGKQMIDNIIINTVIPILFSYGIHKNENQFKEIALQWLEELSAEKNSITRGFEKLKIENKNALDSQFLLQLKNEYCNAKKCLECGIGNAILKSKPGNQ